MKILIVNQFFYPDHSAVSQQLTDLAEDLTEAGDEISVICGRGMYQSGELALPKHEEYNGIRIQRVYSGGFGKRTHFGRLADMISFYLTASWAMLWSQRPDVLYVVSTPPLICLAALVVGWLRCLPVVYGIHDLYPDIAVALGVLKPRSWITRVLDWLSIAGMRRMDRLIVLGRYAKQLLERKGIAAEKIVVLENWADPALNRPIAKADNWFLRENNLQDKFVVLYSGNMGLAHEFETILGAARQLADHPDIVFLFVGEGGRRREVEELRDQYRLPNVKMMGYQDRGDLSYSLSAGDVFLVSLRPGGEGLVLPCKIYAGMAVARPLLFIGTRENDTAETIEHAGCGWVFAPGDAAGLAAKILELRNHPELAAQFGARGRQALETQYSRGHATAGYRQVFGETAGT